MANTRKTAIVTGGSQGIGAGIVKAFLDRGYNVVATSRNITKSGEFQASDKLALVDGNIAEAETAAKIAEAAMSKFGSIDALVNNAGIYFSKNFTDYTDDDLRSFFSVNIEGFLLHHSAGGQADAGSEDRRKHRQYFGFSGESPDRRRQTPSVPMITKGGLEAATRSLAMEYAKQGIRVNAVAPGVVETSMHEDSRRNFSRRGNRWGRFPK